jgi:catechol-2,3-dioxygenase
VTDIARGVGFYPRVRGRRVRRRQRGVVCLASAEATHDIALYAHQPDGPRPPIWVGCRFIGFEVGSKDALARVCERLGGARMTIVDARDSLSVHTTDPDGNGVEIYCLAASAESASGAARTLTLAELRAAARAEAAEAAGAPSTQHPAPST